MFEPPLLQLPPWFQASFLNTWPNPSNSGSTVALNLVSTHRTQSRQMRMTFIPQTNNFHVFLTESVVIPSLYFGSPLCPEPHSNHSLVESIITILLLMLIKFDLYSWIDKKTSVPHLIHTLTSMRGSTSNIVDIWRSGLPNLV